MNFVKWSFANRTKSLPKVNTVSPILLSKAKCDLSKPASTVTVTGSNVTMMVVSKVCLIGLIVLYFNCLAIAVD